MNHTDVLAVWFGDIGSDGSVDDAYRTRWWKKDPKFDQFLRDKFADVHTEIMNGECEDWLADAHGRLAYIIVLDQFSRNMFRGTPEMFAADDGAVAAAHEGVDCGDGDELSAAERTFLYMPLMHSEDLGDQSRAISLFTSLVNEVSGKDKERAESQLKYAIQHRDIIKRFGRFPHRNDILGRESTDEEREFLTQPGSSF